MAEKTWPVHYYKDGHLPKYAHDKKQEDALLEEGWVSNRRMIPVQEYPKTLYHQDTGETEIVGKFDKHGKLDIEAAKQHEQLLRAEGYSEKRVIVEAPEAGAPVSNTRIDKLEKDVRELKEGLAAILEAVTSGSKKGK